MGYGGWMGVGILPLLWSYTNTRATRVFMAVLSPVACSFIMTSLFTVFYLAAQFIWNVGAIMVNPVFLLSSMGAVCIVACSMGMYFAIPYYMRKKEESESDSEAGSEVCSESENEGTESSEHESENETEGSEATESEGTVSDAESTDIEPDNSWREQANFEALRTAPELPA